MTVHYRIHKTTQHVPVLSLIGPVRAPQPTFRIFILILTFCLHLGLPSGRLSSGFPTKIMYAPLLSHIRATCPPHLSPLDLIIRIMFSEEYRA